MITCHDRAGLGKNESGVRQEVPEIALPALIQRTDHHHAITSAFVDLFDAELAAPLLRQCKRAMGSLQLRLQHVHLGSFSRLNESHAGSCQLVFDLLIVEDRFAVAAVWNRNSYRLFSKTS